MKLIRGLETTYKKEIALKRLTPQRTFQSTMEIPMKAKTPPCSLSTPVALLSCRSVLKTEHEGLNDSLIDSAFGFKESRIPGAFVAWSAEALYIGGSRD